MEPLVPEVEEVKGVMLIDWYSKTVATVDGGGFNEIVLFEHSDTELKLSFFSKDEDSDETRRDCIVDKKALTDCLEIINRFRLGEWSKLNNPTSLSGVVKVVKYRTENGGYIRVSSDKMPEDGERAFDELEKALKKHCKKSSEL